MRNTNDLKGYSEYIPDFFCPYTLGIPLILTIIANVSWKRGDYEKYRIITKVANVLLIIGWIILAVEAIVLIGGFFYFAATFNW